MTRIHRLCWAELWLILVDMLVAALAPSNPLSSFCLLLGVSSLRIFLSGPRLTLCFFLFENGWAYLVKLQSSHEPSPHLHPSRRQPDISASDKAPVTCWPSPTEHICLCAFLHLTCFPGGNGRELLSGWFSLAGYGS